jgi:hypothetical protein
VAAQPTLTAVVVVALAILPTVERLAPEVKVIEVDMDAQAAALAPRVAAVVLARSVETPVARRSVATAVAGLHGLMESLMRAVAVAVRKPVKT